MFLATKRALRKLEVSLQCSACHNLLTEPCTLGNCPHLICKACAANYAGNACPSCQAPAWAKDLQVKRELGMVVRLCRRLQRLINTEPEQEDTASTELSEDCWNVGSLTGESGRDKSGEEEGLGFILNDASEIGDGSETEPMSISESDAEVCKHGDVVREALHQLQGSDTDSLTELGKGNTGRQTGKKRGKVLQNKFSRGDTEYGRVQKGGKRTLVSQKTNGKENSAASKKAPTNKRSTPKHEPSNISEENNPMTVYDFEASPPHPKTRKVKMRIVQQTKREAQLKKVAAANKKWDLVSSVSGSRKDGRKHVSFSDDSLKSGSSSAEDTCALGKSGDKTSHLKTNSMSVTSVEDNLIKDKSKKSKSESGSIPKSSPSATGQTKGISKSGTKDKNKSSPAVSKLSNQKGKNSIEPSPSDTGNLTPKPLPSVPRVGQKRRSPASGPGSSDGKANSTPNSAGKKRKSAEQGTPETPINSSRTGQRKRLSGGTGTSPNLNSSVVSPKTALMKRNKRGETSLHVACIKGDENEVKSLLEQGADPNSKDNAGWTPLHEACNHGHTALVGLLLDHNALINAPGFEHDTPLHDAINNNRLTVIKFLRERGASLETRNIHGQTPLDLPATPAIRKALLTQPLSEVTNSPICTPVTAPSQHLQDRQVVLLATGLKPKEKTALQRCSDLLGGKVVDEFSADVTHLVAACEDDGRCLRTMKYMQAILVGRWVVSFKWVEQCIQLKERVEEVEFEIPGTSADPDSNAAQRGRENVQKQFPGLFDGCHFYFSGTYKHPTPPKQELTKLIKMGGGTILNRQPKPDDDVIQVSTVVPYHARSESQYASCAYYVVYDHLGKRAPPSIRTQKVCTIPVYWLLDCVSQFTILDPPKE